MTDDPTRAPESERAPHPQAPEAELPQAPPGAPEGHDAVAPDDALAADAARVAQAARAAREAAEAYAGAAGAGEPGVGAALPGEPAAGPAQDASGEAAPDVATLTAKAAKADEYLALAQRTQADFENYRKRTLREVKVAQDRGALKLVQALLPAIDNLDRALAHMESTPTESPEGESDGDGSVLAGIRHVHADVIGAFARAGIEVFDPVGEPFDPQFHEAVAQQPVEGAEPGTVVEVFQRGYRLGDSVVRPARVVVAG